MRLEIRRFFFRHFVVWDKEFYQKFLSFFFYLQNHSELTENSKMIYSHPAKPLLLPSYNMIRLESSTKHWTGMVTLMTSSATNIWSVSGPSLLASSTAVTSGDNSSSSEAEHDGKMLISQCCWMIITVEQFSVESDDDDQTVLGNFIRANSGVPLAHQFHWMHRIFTRLGHSVIFQYQLGIISKNYYCKYLDIFSIFCSSSAFCFFLASHGSRMNFLTANHAKSGVTVP